MRRVFLSFPLLAGLLAACAEVDPPPPRTAAIPLNHFIVIYLENHTFDNLYGLFPGANGIAQAANAPPQVNRNGTPYSTLPRPILTGTRRPTADARFPANLPVAPFNIDQYVPPSEKTGDLIHAFYRLQLQIDDGKMDKFVAWSDAAGLALGYYETAKLPLYPYAREYTLADNFFHAAFGSSFLNHIWLISAQTPRWPNPPTNYVARPDPASGSFTDNVVTPDGYIVNTAYSSVGPHLRGLDNAHLVPALTIPTIGDRLNEKNISWAWYAGGWDDAIAGKPDPLFQTNHQPFAYYKNYGTDTIGAKEHLKDENEFLAALRVGALPAVSFVKPLGEEDEHPGYGSVNDAESHAADLVAKIQASPVWKDCAIIITYDDYGGYWDHVAPPKIDRWGPGTRVPTLIISPYAKKGFVDHTLMDTTSILALIEKRFGLAPLSERDAKAHNLLSAFDFNQK